VPVTLVAAAYPVSTGRFAFSHPEMPSGITYTSV